MSMMMNAMVNLNWHHDDPREARKEIEAALGDISWFRLIGSQVLLANYMRPITTRGGIITGLDSQNEDIFQGTVGMIVAIGPTCWRETTTRREKKDMSAPGEEMRLVDVDVVVKGDEERFGGALPQIGDWVYCRPQDTVMCALKGPRSEMLRDAKGEKRAFQGWPCKLVYAKDIYAFADLPHAIL